MDMLTLDDPCNKDTLDEPQPSATYRKHSSGDLHSRLKTRKILGVGETDNGDIHRSKISQLLGHNEHLYVKFPKGYSTWHVSMALIFGLFGFINLFYPDYSFDIPKWSGETSHQFDIACRYYGCTSLAISFLFVSFWGTMDKGVVRTLLLTVALCHSLQVLALFSTEWGHLLNWRTLLHLLIRIALVLPNAYFYRNIGFCGLRMRKSTSFNNLRDCGSTNNSQYK
ncbi:tumor protein p53-inducible protein 11 isoform X2 [Parasteatoda tepidariorum]|uniref:tumor protein p53-inducible protein 11 isoform X2 n=1 Tax=Parasteatoda tepidariorum TaxID=114398 RepID=UPI00077F9CB1|nr:tumor protein p53-inducible protein 11 isoform X2 [Parasteatoda tepidariorum]XP_042902636.1 tumor protein p53-inducible protein 11 isoform X2 [Parasteatoda tepidariorum]